MALHLTIDRGNTMTKIALWDGAEPVVVRQIVKATTGKIFPLLAGYDIDRAILCSVAGGFDGLALRLRRRGIRMVTLRAQMPLPLKINYARPDLLGPDRIAAAVGASTLFPGREILVADLGTAATYDLVTADGTFAGGNIAPGVGMRLRALNSFTARLPLVNASGEIPLWGYSTDTALRSGAVRGVCAEIAYYRAKLSSDALTVLTGGWGAEVAKMLDFDVIVNDNLVLTGLNSILQYNEI